ncbi:hypothetical protein pEaSNUABM12_00081 [Erwinia phage pEa_SNUABM_12]|nr:hypothetical protein pEaSNUABM12_00081 [Erwinia phage pEa_SNUABM_12]QXO11776.1 hypothetical protein pEaSNUABM44_00080 [Erwinia phage pEa_SNUABM_44]
MTIEIKLNDKTYELPTDIDIMDEPDDERVIKLSLTREGMTEGIWIVIHEKDLEDYQNNVVDEEYTRVCSLSNHAVCGIPWGAYVPYKLQGGDRPIAVFEDIINTETDEVFFPAKVLAAYKEANPESEEDSEE